MSGNSKIPDSKDSLDSDLADLEAFLDEFDAGLEQKAAEDKTASFLDKPDEEEEPTLQEQFENSVDYVEPDAEVITSNSPDEGEVEPDIFTAADDLEEEFNQSLAEAGLLDEDEEQAGESNSQEEKPEEEMPEVARTDAAGEIDSEIPVAMEAIELPLEEIPDDPQPESAWIEEPAPIMASEVESHGPSQQVVFVGILLLVVFLVSAVGGIWMSFGLKAEVASLKTSLAELQKSSQDSRRSEEEMAQVRNDLVQLQQRISDVGMIIEGPMKHLQESGKERFQQLSERLASVEASLTKLENRPIAVPSSTAVTAKEKQESWIVNLVSLISKLEANKQIELLKKKDINAVLRHAKIDGKDWYRLQVIGFSSEDEARAFANKVEARTGLKNAWVGKE